MVRKPKLLSSIRAKLFSAVAMLLVAVIMVVSSTYAWFTLSTAPEVTGMTTAIGANGSLEMALLPESGVLDATTDLNGMTDGKSAAVTNRMWGNLVDLSDDTTYGLDLISLLPSTLNESEGVIGDNLLMVPTYGADGRVIKVSPEAGPGKFVDGRFVPGTDVFGVRAVGVSSGRTARQTAYINARSSASTAKAQAQNKASATLNANGSALANIAIKYGMNSTNAAYEKAEIAPLIAIVNDLNGAGGVLEKLDEAYMQYMLALAASKPVTDDNVWSTVEGYIKAEGATADSVLAQLKTLGVEIPTTLETAINALKETKTKVQTADTELTTLNNSFTAEKTTVTWGELRSVMEKLADPAQMTINGFKASEVKEKLGDLVSSVTAQGGLKVTMASGAGVFADVADHCGDYTASIVIERVEYDKIVLNNMNAQMLTASTVNPAYLETIGSSVTAAGEPEATGSTEVKPINEFYGYIIDLAFRTNAAESNLLLQTDAADRIYADNANPDTVGHGSSMTFASTSTFFSNDQVKNLMKNLRIVFFTPATTGGGTILAEARLDTTNATIDNSGVTAKMYLYDETAAETDGSYDAGFKKTDSAIMALTQNTATKVSVLVYLEGENLQNSDVAFSASDSVTGSMNLQFASSATLVPMENGELHQAGGETESESTATQNP